MVKLTDEVLNIVNEKKVKMGLAETYAPLVPKLTKINDELRIMVLLTKIEDDVFNINENIIADYWVLLDPKTLKILEFNKTIEKDYRDTITIKATNDDAKEIVDYSIKKRIQYKNYLINDILNNCLTLQKKLSNLLDNKIKVDGEYVSLDNYINANIEEEVNEVVDNAIEKVADLAVRSKYSTLTYYYEELFNRTIDIFNEDNIINDDMIDAINEILKNYYVGVIF